MRHFKLHIVLPPETQDRVDNLIKLMRLLVVIGILLLVLVVILAVVGLGIGSLVWKKETGTGRQGHVTCQCGGQEIKKTQ